MVVCVPGIRKGKKRSVEDKDKRGMNLVEPLVRTLTLYPVFVIVAMSLSLSLPADETLAQVALHVVEVAAVHVAQPQDCPRGLDLLVRGDPPALDVDHLGLGAPRVVLAVRDGGVVPEELDVVGLLVGGRVLVDPPGPARCAGEDELSLGDVVVVRTRARVGHDRGDGAAPGLIGDEVGVDPVAATAASSPASVDPARLPSAFLASTRAETIKTEMRQADKHVEFPGNRSTHFDALYACSFTKCGSRLVP